MKNLAILLCLCLALYSSCSSDIQLDIDNPHNKEVQVVLDDEVIALPPKATTTVSVARGEHSLKLENDSIITYNFDQDKYLINPTRTDYLIEKLYFSRSGNPALEATFNKINRKTVTYLGYEIQGNYEVLNDLIMPKDWHYKQRQAVPEAISVENKKFNSSKTIRKLYAADEFLQLLQDRKSDQ